MVLDPCGHNQGLAVELTTAPPVLVLLSRCTEDGCPHKKFFHTRFLMRMRLTPDCSKMLISTSSGYLLILHDLDLNKSLEVGSYPILRARRTTSSSGECCGRSCAVGCPVGRSWPAAHVFWATCGLTCLLCLQTSRRQAPLALELWVHPVTRTTQGRPRRKPCHGPRSEKVGKGH